MKRPSLAVPGALLGLLALHEGALWALAASDLPSVLFAPGPHSPLLYVALTVGFLGVRLIVYFVAPCLLAAWLAVRGLELLSAAVDRRVSVDASHSRATPWQTTAPTRRPDPPRASHPNSST